MWRGAQLSIHAHPAVLILWVLGVISADVVHAAMFACLRPSLPCAVASCIALVPASARALEETKSVLWLRSAMLLLSRGDRSQPEVREARWMSAAWVKMCFCLLSLGDFHSILSRAHSAGQGAPLLLPCAGELWKMYLDIIQSWALEVRDNSRLSVSC